MSDLGIDVRVPSHWVVKSCKIEGKKTIGTHNGTFHCDEALACAMLMMLPEWADAMIVRTRDPAELVKCDVVVDVGAVYDPDTRRFDHHQRTFHDTLKEEGFGTRLSSAGLVYRHYGRAIMKHVLEGSPMPEDVRDTKAYRRAYKTFVEHIDGIDNGVEACQGSRRYELSSHLSARVSRLNRTWNEPSDGPDGDNERFKQAMSITGGEFYSTLRELSDTWWPARSIVESSIASRRENHPSGKIVVLSQFCPWKSHLTEVEEDLGIQQVITYVLYPSSEGNWRVQAVPKHEEGFELRLPLPTAWQGLRDEELSEVAGIEGCIFVHANGFISANTSKQGALAMAVKALDVQDPDA